MRGHIAKKVSKSTGKTRYYPVLYLGYGATGKKEYKWLPGHNSNKAAEKALNAAVRELDTGTFVEPSKELFGAYMQRWLEDKKSTIRASTYESYRWLVEDVIVPRLGTLELSKLKPQHLQQMYSELSNADKPLSNRSVRYAHTLIHGALGRAVKWGLVTRNVSEAVEPPRLKRRQTSVWTAANARQFLETSRDLEPRYWIGFYLALMTGMRKGEVLALKWADISRDNGYAYVHQTLKWIDGEPRLEYTKTDRSSRAVGLSKDVFDALDWQRDRQLTARADRYGEYHDNDLILAKDNGTPMHPRVFDRGWLRALNKSGLPIIRFHDLRHTHASLLLQQGVHPKVVSERLGHSSIGITMDIYSHVLPGIQKEVAQNFSDSIFGPRKSISESED